MMFYGLPIHIMRDLFLTTRSFLKRLSALVKYRKALADMNKYPDATQEELAREDTCIICREEMRPWDPATPGAVERSRPKKLPCGHILHFGCLKGWLERQQVCPTCRRSVVIDGAAPNGDGAARPNAGGQAPDAGQPGAANGDANGNQAQQGRQGGMRMFQLGPLRLGFAQGNPQRVQELIQQRFNVGPDGAQAPIVPPPPADAQQPLQPEPYSAGRIRDINLQLQDIQQRLQHELLTMQATQAELQTTYFLMAELQRLRLTHQLAQNASLSGGSGPALNGQALNPQPALGPAPNQFPMMPQTMASFPPMPQRIHTPSVTRHTATTHSTSIPAGSPDLPEGLTIPQGWTLMPLQRMDGVSPQIPQSSGPQNEAAEQPPVSQDLGGDATSGSVGQEHSTTTQANTAPADVATASSSQTRTEPSPVAAPTPRMPNWGGAAQLFANGGVGTSPAPIADSEAIVDAGSSQSNKEREETSVVDKGKAKAVTLEDASDDSVDE